METLQHVLDDLRRSPHVYLGHADEAVRRHARAAMDAYKIRADGVYGLKPEANAHLLVARLARALEAYNAAEQEGEDSP